MDIVSLLFLLVALLMIVGAFWNGTTFLFTVSRAISLVIGLIVLYIVYLLVTRILGLAL